MKKINILLCCLLLSGCVTLKPDPNRKFKGVPEEAVEMFMEADNFEKSGKQVEALERYEAAISYYDDFKEAHLRVYRLLKKLNPKDLEHIYEHEAKM